MTLYDLYLRIIGTTGLDVIDLPSLRACISNCMADLTSRGYKLFKELHLSDFENVEQDLNWMCLDLPKDIRKINYLRLYLTDNATVATRVPLTDKRIQCLFKNGKFRSKVDDWEAVYYILNDKLYIEWNTTFGLNLQELSFGYYQKLYAPEMPLDPNDSDQLKSIELDIRPEFEDALVLYAAYFYTARVLKDSDKINLALSNYKYYVEDIVHELSYEDEFNEEDAVIKIEEDD
jgi:hypothetical protein